MECHREVRIMDLALDGLEVVGAETLALDRLALELDKLEEVAEATLRRVVAILHHHPHHHPHRLRVLGREAKSRSA